MDFLKKDSSHEELAFKEPSRNISVPVGENMEETIPEPSQEATPDPFSSHEEFMPPAPEHVPRETVGEPEHTIPDQDIDAPPKPMSLPDLPDLPLQALAETVGVTATPEEVAPPSKPVEEPTVFETPAVVQTEEPIAQESVFAQDAPKEIIFDQPLDEEPEVSESQPELPDPYPEDTDAAYLAEETDEEEKDYYVEAHAFYQALLDIKAMKKSLRDQDADMRGWEEIDEKLEKKATSVLRNIDNIQEDLIKIDTTLFEG